MAGIGNIGKIWMCNYEDWDYYDERSEYLGDLSEESAEHIRAVEDALIGLSDVAVDSIASFYSNDDGSGPIFIYDLSPEEIWEARLDDDFSRCIGVDEAIHGLTDDQIDAVIDIYSGSEDKVSLYEMEPQVIWKIRSEHPDIFGNTEPSLDEEDAY